MKTILDAMSDRELFGSTFRPRLLRGDSWRAWRAFLAALFALPMDDDALALYRKHTGRSDPPSGPFSECWAICGRRSGKSLIAATVGVFLSAFRDYSAYRAPGEVLLLPIIAPDRRQCRTVLGYINGLFDASPTLGSMVKERLKESVELTNGVRIEVATASYRTVRGPTAVGCIIDEAAFLRSEESATPDSELVAAVTPMMATVPGALLLGISSPYARRGVLWENYKQHFGKSDSRILVWAGETVAMNPTISRAVIEAAYERDPAAASAEYGAQFRSDVQSFLPAEAIEACVVSGRRELPPVDGLSYNGFVDPSGGASDAFTIAVAHLDKDRAVLDLVREVRPPFSPEATVREFAETLRRYRVFSVTGDRYGGEWPREQFSKLGTEYRVAEKTRSELYLEMLPAIMSGQIELLDNARLVTQLGSLERRTARGGRDSIEHSPGTHDDVANAGAGALVEALRAGGGVFGVLEYLKGIDAGTIPFPERLPPAPVPVPPSDCPSCNSELIVNIGGGGKRCQQCGTQFGIPQVAWRGPDRLEASRKR